MRSNRRSPIVVFALILSLGLWLVPTVQAAEPVRSSQATNVDTVDAGFVGWMDRVLESLEGLVFTGDFAAASSSDCTDCTTTTDDDTNSTDGGNDGGGPQPTGDGLGGIDVNG